MKEIIPLIIFCCVGIALCITYMVLQFIKLKKNGVKTRREKREEFEIDDDDVLTIRLDKKK